MLLQYSLHEPRRGRDDIEAFMRHFRAAFGPEHWGTQALSLKATVSVAGKAAVRIPARPSATSLSDRFRRRRVARCASAARLCCVFRMAESSKRSVSTTALPLSCSSVCCTPLERWQSAGSTAETRGSRRYWRGSLAHERQTKVRAYGNRVASRATSSDLKARAGVSRAGGIRILAASTNAKTDDNDDGTDKLKDSRCDRGRRSALDARCRARSLG